MYPITLKSMVKCGYHRYINLNSIANIEYFFDKDGGDIGVTIWFSDNRCENYFLDHEEFEEFIGGIERALV